METLCFILFFVALTGPMGPRPLGPWAQSPGPMGIGVQSVFVYKKTSSPCFCKNRSHMPPRAKRYGRKRPQFDDLVMTSSSNTLMFDAFVQYTWTFFVNRRCLSFRPYQPISEGTWSFGLGSWILELGAWISGRQRTSMATSMEVNGYVNGYVNGRKKVSMKTHLTSFQCGMQPQTPSSDTPSVDDQAFKVALGPI